MFTAVGQIDFRGETTGIQLNPLGQTSQGRWVLHATLAIRSMITMTNTAVVWTGLVQQLIFSKSLSIFVTLLLIVAISLFDH